MRAIPLSTPGAAGIVAIATAVLGGTIPDPTGGATNFFDPALEDKLFAEGKVSTDADALTAKWTAGGLRAVAVEGVDPDTLQFFKPA